MPAFPSWAFTRCHHHSNWGSRHPIAAYILLIYRPRKDERLSWPSWLTCSGWFTHLSGHPSATGRALKTDVGPRNQPIKPQSVVYFWWVDGCCSLQMFSGGHNAMLVINTLMAWLVPCRCHWIKAHPLVSPFYCVLCCFPLTTHEAHCSRTTPARF